MDLVINSLENDARRAFRATLERIVACLEGLFGENVTVPGTETQVFHLQAAGGRKSYPLCGSSPKSWKVDGEEGCTWLCQSASNSYCGTSLW